MIKGKLLPVISKMNLNTAMIWLTGNGLKEVKNETEANERFLKGTGCSYAIGGILCWIKTSYTICCWKCRIIYSVRKCGKYAVN